MDSLTVEKPITNGKIIVSKVAIDMSDKGFKLGIYSFVRIQIIELTYNPIKHITATIELDANKLLEYSIAIRRIKRGLIKGRYIEPYIIHVANKRGIYKFLSNDNREDVEIDVEVDKEKLFVIGELLEEIRTDKPSFSSSLLKNGKIIITQEIISYEAFDLITFVRYNLREYKEVPYKGNSKATTTSVIYPVELRSAVIEGAYKMLNNMTYIHPSFFHGNSKRESSRMDGVVFNIYEELFELSIFIPDFTKITISKEELEVLYELLVKISQEKSR